MKRRTGIVAVAVVVALAGYAAADAVDVVPGILTSDVRGPAASAGAGTAPGPADPRAENAGTGPRLPPVLAAPTAAAVPSAAGVAAVLRPLLAAKELGPGVAVDVRDAATGAPLYTSDATRPAVPASTTKILTAAAVGTADDLTARFRTRVVAGRTGDEVVLVAGGDNLLAPGRGTPTAVLGRAGLADLAARAAASLGPQRRTPVRVVLDDSFAKGPALAPGWAAADVNAGLTGPVAMLGLATDRAVEGRAATADPAMTAAVAFRAALATQHVPVAPTVTRGAAGAGATELAAVDSAPVGDVLALALDESDNDLTESVARWACARKGQPTTFAGCAAWVQATVTGLEVARPGVRLLDTSGLTRGTTIPAAAISDVLTLAADGRHRDISHVVARLPVAGLTGTLAQRYRTGPERSGAGLVRAKTGTLTGVSTLAGTVVDADGRLLTFTIIADRVPAGGTLAARAALDRVAAALAGCGCR